MRVKEWQNEVVFLHEVAPGAADRSYGIHVAQLAGLPAAVVARAEEVLAALEKGEQSGAVTRLADDLPLFAAAPARPARRRRPRPQESEVEKALGDGQSRRAHAQAGAGAALRAAPAPAQVIQEAVFQYRSRNERLSGSGCCQPVTSRKSVASP